MDVSRRLCNGMLVPLLIVLLIGALLGGPVREAWGQSRFQTQRAYVASPQVIGQGNAGVALPRARSVFFYNPAHLTRTEGSLVLMGVQGAFSTDISDQIQFFSDRLEPALDQGLETLSDDELQALYEDTIDRGYRPTTVDGSVILPAIVWQMGPVGAGIGLFSNTDLTYRFGNAGLGVPFVELVGRTDVMVRASAGVEFGRLGLPGLAVGLTGSFTRRYFTFKSKPLDAIDAGDEVVVLDGTSLGVDIGLLYEPPVMLGPGTLTLGAAIYDLQATGFDYEFYGTPEDVPVLGGAFGGESETPSAQQIDREVRRARTRFGLTTSYRLGAAYRIQRLAALPGVAVAVDYIGYEDAPVNQSFLTHLHAGVEVQLLRSLALRTGLSQGYPTVGIGVGLGPVDIDYAFYGVEHGRFPGQIPSYQHNVQLTFTLF